MAILSIDLGNGVVDDLVAKGNDHFKNFENDREQRDWQKDLEESAGACSEGSEAITPGTVYMDDDDYSIQKPDFSTCSFEELKVYARATEDPEALFLVAERMPSSPNDPTHNQEYIQNPGFSQQMRIAYLKRSAAKGYMKAVEQLVALGEKQG